MFVDWITPRLLRAPEDGTGAGAAAGDPPAGDGGAQPKWFEGDRWQGDTKTFIEAKGLSKFEDPNEAISHLIGMGQAADKRFGRPIDSVLDKPKEGQPLHEWRRANAGAVGLPKDLPESIAWDKGLEDRFRSVVFERGLSQDDVKAMTGLYAEHVKGMMDATERAISDANSAMMADLQRTFAGATEEKIAQARQAAQVVGERTGLDASGIEAVASVLTTKTGGDAATIRFFAALGEMMGEDKGRGFGAGNGGMAMTAAEAQTKLAEMRAPGGAFFEAKTAADRARIGEEIERLTKIATKL